MPRTEKAFVIPLNPFGDFIGVWFAKTSSEGVVEFAVEYQARIDGEERQVVRYDGAHGFAHRDLLDWHGNVIRKTPMREGISYQGNRIYRLRRAADDEIAQDRAAFPPVSGGWAAGIHSGSSHEVVKCDCPVSATTKH